MPEEERADHDYEAYVTVTTTQTYVVPVRAPWSHDAEAKVQAELDELGRELWTSARIPSETVQVRVGACIAEHQTGGQQR